MQVLYFASVREKVGLANETIDPPRSVETVDQLMDWLARRSDRHAAAFANRLSVRAALDQVHAPAGTKLAATREVAFFPPVTGG